MMKAQFSVIHHLPTGGHCWNSVEALVSFIFISVVTEKKLGAPLIQEQVLLYFILCILV